MKLLLAIILRKFEIFSNKLASFFSTLLVECPSKEAKSAFWFCSYHLPIQTNGACSLKQNE